MARKVMNVPNAQVSQGRDIGAARNSLVDVGVNSKRAQERVGTHTGYANVRSWRVFSKADSYHDLKNKDATVPL
jgi:hypothetical protein